MGLVTKLRDWVDAHVDKSHVATVEDRTGETVYAGVVKKGLFGPKIVGYVAGGFVYDEKGRHIGHNRSPHTDRPVAHDDRTVLGRRVYLDIVSNRDDLDPSDEK